MTLIGTSPPRPDGLSKASGASLFADDSVLPGMFYGATLRSPLPRARLDRVAWNRDGAHPEAVHVVAADLPGVNGVQLLSDDWPILAQGEVCHVGEAVALVAAPTLLEARRALRALKVDYTPLPPRLSLEEAEADAPLASLELTQGDAERGLREAAVVVEGTYRTGHQEHVYIECQGMTAWYEPDGSLVVDGTMQCPYFVHRSLVHALGLPPEKVRVKVSAVGGGFGGKEDYPSLIALHAALLARASGRPVRLIYDRHEDIVATTKRHPSLVRHRAGVDREGRLVAMDIELVLDGGAYTTLSPVVLSRAVLHAAGPYRCPNVRVRGKAVRTNTAPNGAFRGFGAPQAQFATERQMDRLGRSLGLDPLEIRLLNALRSGDRLPTGQVLDDSTAAVDCLEKVERETRFQRRWREREGARAEAENDAPAEGVGLSLYFHGCGFTGEGEHRMRSPVDVQLLDDGRLEVRTAMVDMGQGVSTVFRQIASQVSGLGMDDLVFAEPDTARVPDSGPTVASRTTLVVGSAMAEAVSEACTRIKSWWAETRGIDAGSDLDRGTIRWRDGSVSFREAARRYLEEEGPLLVRRRYEPPAEQVFDEATYKGSAYPTYGWGADVVEVVVDPDTFEVRPVKATVVCEVGRAIHPTLCAGQVEGGTLQALGWALLEEIKIEGGRYLNDRLATYIIPTSQDAPRCDVHLLERPWKGGVLGAKGVGELPMDGGAPAAVAAVENATGILVSEIPATPEHLFAWWAAKRSVDEPGSPSGEPDAR